MIAFAALAAGIAAGSIHVVTGPDHLAAVAPLAVHRKAAAWRAGVLWGLGHSGGTWALAAIAVAFREALPIDSLSAWSERLVGIVLVAVGFWGLHRVVKGLGGASVPSSDHADDHGQASRHGRTHRHAHGHGALGIGTLHGIAGTSHLLGVLPALAFPDRSHALAYVFAFGLGSILAMTAFASLLGLAARGSLQLGSRGYAGFMSAACIISIGVGVFWMSQAAGHHHHLHDLESHHAPHVHP
ncbi:MAG: High-affinity nickel transporter [Planctomycetota bacterium]|nr:High-affinity nickel transporter [Planctomycetota bacterium]